MMTVATVFYQRNPTVPKWSGCFSPEWVDKLYRGVARNYNHDFRFVCLTDRLYAFEEEMIEQQPLKHVEWSTTCLQLHAIESDRLALMGLDTVIVGPLDELFSYEGALAVPRDPYRPDRPCNGVVLCPTRPDIAAVRDGSDMQALERFPYDWLDDLYPGQVVSYKGRVVDHGLQDARIVYLHGEPKQHVLDEPWVRENWR